MDAEIFGILREMKKVAEKAQAAGREVFVLNNEALVFDDVRVFGHRGRIFVFGPSTISDAMKYCGEPDTGAGCMISASAGAPNDLGSSSRGTPFGIGVHPSVVDVPSMALPLILIICQVQNEFTNASGRLR